VRSSIQAAVSRSRAACFVPVLCHFRHFPTGLISGEVRPAFPLLGKLKETGGFRLVARSGRHVSGVREVRQPKVVYGQLRILTVLFKELRPGATGPPQSLPKRPRSQFPVQIEPGPRLFMTQSSNLLDTSLGYIRATLSPTSSASTQPTMIIVSRPLDVPTPSPFPTLDEDLDGFLRAPYRNHPAADGGPPVITPTPNDPEFLGRLLSYAYGIYDTFVTRQLPHQSIPSHHAVLLRPLLEVLYESHPSNSSIALLLGSVYYHQDLAQRCLQINNHILQYDPQNVRSYPPPSLPFLFVDYLRITVQTSAMCNLGTTLHAMDLPVQAFEWWWKGLQISPTNWDILVGALRECNQFLKLTTGKG
jgi:hypothetical protein